MITTRQIDRHSSTTACQTDAGYTVLDLLGAIAALGILVAGVIFAVSGMSAEAASTGCRPDSRQLQVAVETYLSESNTDLIPATGTDHDRFERTLVDGDFMRAVSTFHDLDATGAAIPQEDSSC